jgi:hypothetical protein
MNKAISMCEVKPEIKILADIPAAIRERRA